MKTYLVQRGFTRNLDFKKGIDSIVRFDYMGASEYEWGALPKSLENIRKNISEYEYIQLDVKGFQVTVFTPSKFIPEIPDFINQLAKGEMPLKCYSGFDEVVKESKLLKYKPDFWWDIENHLMFWISNKTFESKFKEIIVNKPE